MLGSTEKDKDSGIAFYDRLAFLTMVIFIVIFSICGGVAVEGRSYGLAFFFGGLIVAIASISAASIVCAVLLEMDHLRIKS